MTSTNQKINNLESNVSATASSLTELEDEVADRVAVIRSDITAQQEITTQHATDIEAIRIVNTQQTADIAQNTADIATLQSGSGGGGWNSDNLYIASNSASINMGNTTAYNPRLNVANKSASWLSHNSSNGNWSVNDNGWYRINYNALFQQNNPADYGIRVSVRMGLWDITSNSVDNNIGFSDGYLRGNTGTASNDLNRFVYVVNSAYTYLFASKTYSFRVNCAIAGSDFNSSLNNILLQSCLVQVEKLG